MKLPASSPFSTALMRIRESLLFAFMFILPSVVLILANTQMLSVNADGVYANLGTADAADGSNDSINFSQGRVWTIDSFGKYIWLTQERTLPSSHWAWSNDLGANWTQGGEAYTFLTRASVAYDENNDKLHVIWAATDSADGIIYRRYGITRDGSNNITAITREDAGNINLQLDTATSGNILEQPVALWLDDGSTNGSLVAVWSVRVDGGSDVTEIRGSMRQLSLSAADGIAGNWKALDGTGDVFAVEPPAVAADKIYGVTSLAEAAPSAVIRGGTGTYKDDLYVFVAETEGTSQILAYRAAWNAANDDWSGGWQAPITVGAMGSGGYNLKHQLITKPVLDPDNDRLYVGWARWDDTDGDTVSFAYLSSTNAVSATYDVYSAMGVHAYAPTLDIAYDSELDRLFVSYIESTTNGSNGSIFYVEFDGTTISAPTVFYTSPGGAGGGDGGADIPILFERRSSNNRLLYAFRVNGELPLPTAPGVPDPEHEIYWGYVSLPSITPSPTMTPTPTNTPVPGVTATVTNTPVPGSATAVPTSTGTITPTPNPTLEPTGDVEEEEDGIVSLPETGGEEEEQGGVQIVFVDRDGNPVSGAIVEIEDESYVTDESGQITLDLPEGDYKARVDYDGKSYSEKFSVLGTDNEEIEVTLKKSSLLPVLVIVAVLSGLAYVIFKKKGEDDEQKHIK